MKLSERCVNCGRVERGDFPGFKRRDAVEWFKDDLLGLNWARVQGEWYCGACSRAARLADTGYMVPTIGGGAKGG